jgi:dGTPase
VRHERRHLDTPGVNSRSAFQRDRERILHATAFRRLAGVTQVVGSHEGHGFHNRLTHVLKVAQISRGLALQLASCDKEVVEAAGGLDPDVAEGAALGHDLGHPPFGHIAEEELDHCLKKRGLGDGYEGNAQSFRIVTKLAIRSELPGLNLTAATLNGLLKYPWHRHLSGKKQRKFGAYFSEHEDFLFARQEAKDERRSLEAEIMDWSDDIAYSVFDLEDFFKAGLIPLNRLLGKDDRERKTFLDRTAARWKQIEDTWDINEHEDALEALVKTGPIRDAFDGSREARRLLRNLTTTPVGSYMKGVTITPEGPNRLSIPRENRLLVAVLKEMTWDYVITSESLTTQQFGFRRIIREIFEIFFDEASAGRLQIFPAGTREALQDASSSKSDPAIARIVADYVASLTEQQAVAMHGRLVGTAAGTALRSIL